MAACHAPCAEAGVRLGEWCRYRGAGLDLVTDAGEGEALAIAQTIVRLRPVAEAYLPGEPAADAARLQVLVFAQRSDFRGLTGDARFSGYMDPSARVNRLVVSPGEGSLASVALHEYAHYLLRNRLGVSLPVWFDEGLASLLGAVRFDEETAVIGELPEERMEALLRERLPVLSLTAMLEAQDVRGWSTSRIAAFYDLSWLTVHYLLLADDGDASGAATRAMLQSFLATRGASLPEQLGTSSAGLERALLRHLRHPPERRVTTAPAQATVERLGCLSEIERDVLLADTVAGVNPKAAQRLLRPYVRRPGPDARVLTAMSRAQADLDPALAGELARDALAAAQALGDPAVLADALINAANLEIAGCLVGGSASCTERWRLAVVRYREALREDPERHDAVLGLGLAYLYTGQAGQAVNYLRVAYAQAPWAAPVNLFLGEACRITGDSRAWQYLTNARNWSDGVWRTFAERSLAELGDG